MKSNIKIKKIIILLICVTLFCSCDASPTKSMSGTYVTLVGLSYSNYEFDFAKDKLDDYLDYLITATKETSSPGFFPLIMGNSFSRLVIKHL